jgi:site-specific recombinase XerC
MRGTVVSCTPQPCTPAFTETPLFSAGETCFSLTVKEPLLEHWMPAQKAQELRRATLGQYQGVIDNWIGPRLGGTKVASLTPATVVEYMTALRSEPSAHRRPGLSARSTQLSVGILKSACSWAVGAELVGRNPIATVRRPRAQAPAMKV